jgi:cytochrome bd-type quinol oxidase subunit 2
VWDGNEVWLLVGRGLGLELRHQSQNPLWRSACETVFWLSSGALAFVFGVALGNVVRGVPLGPDGYFRAPLFDLLNWHVARRLWRAKLVLVPALGYPTYRVREEMLTSFGVVLAIGYFIVAYRFIVRSGR